MADMQALREHPFFAGVLWCLPCTRMLCTCCPAQALHQRQLIALLQAACNTLQHAHMLSRCSEGRCCHCAGVDWDGVRSSTAPELAPCEAADPEEFNWELSSLAAALPSYIVGSGPDNPQLPSTLSEAAAALPGMIFGSPSAQPAGEGAQAQSGGKQAARHLD